MNLGSAKKKCRRVGVALLLFFLWCYPPSVSKWFFEGWGVPSMGGWGRTPLGVLKKRQAGKALNHIWWCQVQWGGRMHSRGRATLPPPPPHQRARGADDDALRDYRGAWPGLTRIVPRGPGLALLGVVGGNSTPAQQTVLSGPVWG